MATRSRPAGCRFSSWLQGGTEAAALGRDNEAMRGECCGGGSLRAGIAGVALCVLDPAATPSPAVLTAGCGSGRTSRSGDEAADGAAGVTGAGFGVAASGSGVAARFGVASETGAAARSGVTAAICFSPPHHGCNPTANPVRAPTTAAPVSNVPKRAPPAPEAVSDRFPIRSDFRLCYLKHARRSALRSVAAVSPMPVQKTLTPRGFCHIPIRRQAAGIRHNHDRTLNG